MSDKTLFLSYCFPPMGIPEAFLSAKLIGNLPDCQVTVHATSSWKPWMIRDESLIEYTETHFDEIIRFKIPKLLERFPLIKQDVIGTNSELRETKVRKFLKVVVPIILPFLRLPDPFRILNRYLKKNVLGRDFNYRYVISWSQYHSIQMVGYQLKRKFKDGVIWIAYFGDPWIGNAYLKNNFMVEAINRRLEAKVFDKADIILFPTDEMRNLSVSRYPIQIRAKSRIVAHTFDETLYPKVRSKSKNGKHLFRYLGQFYGIRTPEIIYDSLLQLIVQFPKLGESIKVEIVGNNSVYDIAYEKFLLLPKGLVTFSSQVNYLDSLRLMVEADCLISIDAPASLNVFLSAKIIDYLGAARPVLAFTPPGATSDLVNSYGGWVANSNDPIMGAWAIGEIIKWLDKNGSVDFGDKDVRNKYLVQNVAEEFKRIMHSI